MDSLFEITAGANQTRAIPRPFVDKLAKAIKDAQCPVGKGGRNRRTIYARATSKTPLYKVVFNEQGEIIEVYRRDYSSGNFRWEMGETPLALYKDMAKFVFGKQKEKLVAAYRKEQELKASAIGVGI